MERRVPDMSIGYKILQEGQRLRYYERGRSRFLTEVKGEINEFTPDKHTELARDLFRLALSREGAMQRAALTILKLQLGQRNDHGFYDLGKVHRQTLTANVLAGLNAYADSTHRKTRRQAAANNAVEYVAPYIVRTTETQNAFQEACTRAGLICPTANQTVIEREVFDTLEAVYELSQKRTELSINDIESELLIYPEMIPFYVGRLIGENLLHEGSVLPQPESETIDIGPKIVFSRDTALLQFLEVLILNNYNVPAAANQYGLSERTGYIFLRQLRAQGMVMLPDRQHPKGLKKATEFKVAVFYDALVQNNFNLEQASRACNISESTARSYISLLKKQGYLTDAEIPPDRRVEERRTRRDASLQRAREFITYVREHGSVTIAASAAGISRTTAFKYIRLLKHQPQQEDSVIPPDLK